jgi:hypothetical protein
VAGALLNHLFVTTMNRNILIIPKSVKTTIQDGLARLERVHVRSQTTVWGDDESSSGVGASGALGVKT